MQTFDNCGGRPTYYSLLNLHVRNFWDQRSLGYFCPEMILKRAFKEDRRRWRRQWFNTSVQVFKESDQLDALGVTVSAGGMCLFMLSDLPLGSQVEVEFLPPRSQELVRVSGTVRSRALYLYGIEFLHNSIQDAPAHLGA